MEILEDVLRDELREPVAEIVRRLVAAAIVESPVAADVVLAEDVGCEDEPGAVETADDPPATLDDVSGAGNGAAVEADSTRRSGQVTSLRCRFQEGRIRV